MAQEVWTASPCQIWSKSIEPLRRHDYFSIFPRWQPSAILDLLCESLDHTRRAFGGLYHWAKFGWNPWGSLDNMQVLVFCDFCVKTSIHAPFWWFLGTFPSKNVTHRPNPKKNRPWTEPRHVSHKVWISATWFKLGIGTRKKKDRTGPEKSHKRVIFHLFGKKPPIKRSTWKIV